MTLTVHGIARSRAARTLWMAEELGLAYRHEQVGFRADGSVDESFRRINPMGQVPTIDDDGLILTQSLAINLHLARRHGRSGGLGPQDDGEDGLFGQWTLWAATEVEPHAHEVLVHTINLPVTRRDARRALAAAERLARPLAVLAGALERGGGHLVGGRFTVADLNVACVLFYLRAAPGLIGRHAAIADWWAATTDRPAFKRMMALREAT
jgi:glutathione S-transferase